METKLSKLKEAFYLGDYKTALRIASNFPQLGKERDDIKKAHESYANGSFYKQLGFNIADLQEKGVQALVSKYKL